MSEKQPTEYTLKVEPEVARDPVWKNGPILIVFGEQDEAEVTPGKDLTYPRLQLPLWKRLLGVRPFRITIRLAPPDDDSLAEFGVIVSERLEVPFLAPNEDEDRAVWLPAIGGYRKATQAVSAGGDIIARLADIHVKSAQLKVERG